MPTVGELVQSVAGRLEKAGIAESRLEARLLLADAAGWTLEKIVAERDAALESGVVARVERLAARRLAHEPMSHILGWREFWSLRFRVTPDVLTPRPDSETLIEAVLGALPDRSAPLRILDLGVGSGCLLMALLHELPQASGVGIDRSARALDVARQNAQALGLAGRVDLRTGDWGEGLEETFDIVVSNPPYVPSDDIGTLDPEVSENEPWLALDGGADGLDCFRRLAGELGYLVRPGGIVALEVGRGQAPMVARLIASAGFRAITTHKDLSGTPRVVMARRPSQA